MGPFYLFFKLNSPHDNFLCTPLSKILLNVSGNVLKSMKENETSELISFPLSKETAGDLIPLAFSLLFRVEEYQNTITKRRFHNLLFFT